MDATRPMLHPIPAPGGRCPVTSFSRTTIYDLLGSGDLAAVKVGRRTFVTDESVQRLLNRLEPAKIAPQRARAA